MSYLWITEWNQRLQAFIWREGSLFAGLIFVWISMSCQNWWVNNANATHELFETTRPLHCFNRDHIINYLENGLWLTGDVIFWGLLVDDWAIYIYIYISWDILIEYIVWNTYARYSLFGRNIIYIFIYNVYLFYVNISFEQFWRNLNNIFSLSPWTGSFLTATNVIIQLISYTHYVLHLYIILLILNIHILYYI